MDDQKIILWTCSMLVSSNVYGYLSDHDCRPESHAFCAKTVLKYWRVIHLKFRRENKSITIWSSLNNTHSTVQFLWSWKWHAKLGRRYNSNRSQKSENGYDLCLIAEDIGIQKREENNKCLLAKTHEGEINECCREFYKAKQETGNSVIDQPEPVSQLISERLKIDIWSVHSLL